MAFYVLRNTYEIMRYLLFCTTMLLALGVASAQTTGYTQVNGQYFKYMVDDCGDTLIVADLDDISISSLRTFDNDDDYRRYRRYRRRRRRRRGA